MLNVLKRLRGNFCKIQFVRIPLQLILQIGDLLQKSGIDLHRSLPANVLKGPESVPPVGDHEVCNDAV
jgi:hypothetical protein